MDNPSKIRTGLSGAFLLLLLVLSVVTVAVCLSTRSLVRELEEIGGTMSDAILANGTPVASETTAEEKKTVPTPLYVMTLRDGLILVLDSEGAVARTVDTHAIFLPADDYRLLSEGIPIYSEEELCSLMEDFES